MHVLPKLKYELSALSPLISIETMDFHYNKHHAAYVSNLNKFILGTEFENLSLEDIVRNCKDAKIFNNAGQVWNHNFYWESLSPEGGKDPKGALLHSINDSFGSVELFKKYFSQSALSVFGSGWTWLIDKNGKLEIINTSNAETPLQKNEKCLLALDVWEHAYYIDYRNNRNKYVDIFWDIVNWDFAQKNLEKNI